MLPSLEMSETMFLGWHCKKQTAVALSTTKSECVASSLGAKELLGFKELAAERGIQVALSMTIKIDRQAAIKQVVNEASSKHADVRLKFIVDYYRKCTIQPNYVTTHDMQADILRKPIPAPLLQALHTSVGL